MPEELTELPEHDSISTSLVASAWLYWIMLAMQKVSISER